MSAAQENDEPLAEYRGSRLYLELSPDYSPRTAANVQRWVRFVGASLLQVYGRWPRDAWRVSAAPASAPGSDPVPWAQVHRGDVDTIEFYTAPRAELEQLKRAYTGYHEAAHLLIPYRGWGDLWFSEGLATYYQHILQARSGVISEGRLWQLLYDGFEVGRRDTRWHGQPLAAIGSNAGSDGADMHVYWSGALYFLRADVRLRRQSGGEMSLDKALAALNACCRDERLSVPDMVQRLDQFNDVLLFEPLYHKTRATSGIAATESLFASLGIEIVEGRVALQEFGPGAALRRGISKPRSL
ncbi:MAG: hypothetical protein HKN19_08020 [Halioglobus sp.]|nr:hypothetical protein [Halioglobus sp.]